MVCKWRWLERLVEARFLFGHVRVASLKMSEPRGARAMSHRRSSSGYLRGTAKACSVA